MVQKLKKNDNGCIKLLKTFLDIFENCVLKPQKTIIQLGSVTKYH